ncbi:MAG: hypothetical protein R3351_03940 [Nitrospirales bacterium]|nr:hypothetical protein [Nitrospirales bacterium]
MEQNARLKVFSLKADLPDIDAYQAAFTGCDAGFHIGTTTNNPSFKPKNSLASNKKKN